MFVQELTATHETLLARISAGADPAAWTEFLSRYGELISRVARRHGLQPADCDEVVQDVLTGLCQSMPAFQYDPAKGKFRSYLKTVVLHAVYRRIHQKRREVQLEEMETSVTEPPAEPAEEQAWEAEWRQYHLRLAMRRIRPEFSHDDLAAFEAYALAGQDARQTAAALGMSVDQVYQAKSRILKRLSGVIEEQIREEG